MVGVSIVVCAEDAELEDFVLREKTDIMVPIDVFVPTGGGHSEITSYSCCIDFAARFDELYGADPFSAEAYRFLDEALIKFADELGYYRDKKSHAVINEYVFASGMNVPADLITDGTRLILSAGEIDGLNTVTLHSVDPDPDADDDAAAVMVIGNEIIACSSINDFWDSDMPEINVECVPVYRGHGYATSCAALLTSYLAGRGYDVGYKCRSTNAASSRIAGKIGYKKLGSRLSYVCYRKESERKE